MNDISIESEKTLDKFQYSFIIKIFSKVRIEWNHGFDVLILDVQIHNSTHKYILKMVS